MQLVLIFMLFLVIISISIMYKRVESFACRKKKKKKCMANETKYIPWPIFFGIPQKEDPVITPAPPAMTMPPARIPDPPVIIADDPPMEEEPDMDMEPDIIKLPMQTFPPVEMGTQAPRRILPPPLPSNKGSLDREMMQSGTILAEARKEMYPLINNERTCATLKGLVLDSNLNDAAQKLAVEIIEYDLRTDYPNMSILDQVTVDDRVKSTEWKGGVGVGNVDQILQFSKLLYDTNKPSIVIKDIMCSSNAKNKKIMMNELYTSVGIGYGRGNATDTKTNTKSVYVLLFGKDPNVTAPPIMPPKDGNCKDWANKSACAS